jgi:hypothetical protein
MHEVKLLFRKDLFILINNIKLILKNPLRLIPYVVLVGYFTFIYSSRSKDRAINQEIPELDANGMEVVDFSVQNIKGGLTVLVLGFLIYQLYRATKRNVSFFKMADVNLLFTGPVKPENLLIYYMGRSLLPALGGSLLFIVYGASQMAGIWELNAAKVLFLMLGFALFFFMISPIRFLVYTLHAKYGVLEHIRTGVLVLGIFLGLIILIPGLMADKFWQGMFSWIASPWFDFFPLVGWSRGIMGYVFDGNALVSSLFVGLYVLAFYTVIKLVIQFAGYYYEDVLEATQSNEDQLEKVKGKRSVSEDTYSLNAKKQLELPDFGVGAKAFYWRNYVQSSRQDFHPLVGVYSIGMALVGLVIAGLSNFDWFSHKLFYTYLLVLISFYFMAGISRGSIGDLKKPWFILVPASWSSKFWNMIKLDLVQILLFSSILIIPGVFLAHVSLGLIPLFILAMWMFYLTGLAINLIPQVGLDEGWDRKLIKPFMIGGIFLFGIIPVLLVSIFVYVLTNQFVWTLLSLVLGMSFVTAILMHVTLDVLKRLEFKEV